MRIFRDLFVLIIVLVVCCFNTSAAALKPEQKQVIDSGVHYFDVEIDASTCATSDSPIATSTVDRYLQVLAFHESGGNPTAVNPIGQGAYGKYQYIPLTWRASAQNYYPPALQYGLAHEAPEEVQDAVAYIEYTSKFNALGGDVFKAAVSHYLPAALEDESRLDIVPKGNTLTPREYANRVVEEVNGDVGKDIPLKYRLAPDFDTWLAKVGGTSAPVASGPSSQSGCAPGAGIPAEQFVFYSQYDAKWKDHPFGTSQIGPSGCGPTSVAMVVATLKDKSVTPKEAADFGTANGAYIPGQGSSHQKMLIDGPEHWGLNVTNLGKDMNKAIEVLKSGGLVLAGGQGPVPFTTGGHIIVLRGVSANGKILVGDSAHPEANTAEYDSNELLKSINGLFGVTK